LEHDESSALKEVYRYNSFVRKKYLDALEKLPPDETVRDRGASFPSVVDIFAHVLDAYRSWFVEYGLTIPGIDGRLRGTVKSVNQLREAEKLVDTPIMNFVEGITPADLDRTFEDTDGKRRWRFTLRQMMWHMAEEELQHRGELNALFWQIDIDPPVTDWLDWKTEIGEIKPIS
jgi:uncharacterized damage-inducible protein DinB